jgi:DNA-binding MarR family transcriptional regulator
MPEQTHRHDLATDLTLAMKRLRTRLREESGSYIAGLSIAQLSLLQRLRLAGPSTASALASAEHVSQQAVAQALAPLKAAGLVSAEPDPHDRRKTLIALTDSGRAIREAVVTSRRSWLADAIDTVLSAEDRATLEKAVDVLERLADADV